jgi:CPA2 family monovalent cation:H+ antiporter-2
VLVIALASPSESSLIFSVSMALGRVPRGMIVGRSDYSMRAASDALPMRDALPSVLRAVGMLLDPSALIASPVSCSAALAIVLIGQARLVAMLFVRALRYPFATALTTGVALAQIGEFSFHPRNHWT